MHTSNVQSGPASANAAFLPHPRLQTSYPHPAHCISSPSAPSPLSLGPGCPSAPPASSPPLTYSGFFNGMLEVFEPGALNYFTFSRPILSTLSASKNPILTHLPLSRFLDSLLCVLIVPTPGLTFSLLIPCMLAVMSSFLSGRAYLFLNFLPPLFFLLIYSDYVGINISLNNSSLLYFLNVYALLITLLCRMTKPTSFLSPFSPLSEISSFWRTSIAITPSGTQEVLSTPAGRKYSTGSSPLTSCSMTLTHPTFSIAPLLAFPLLPPLLPFLAPGRCYRTWVLTTYQFFYPSLSLWPIAPTTVPFPSIFRKLAGMALPPKLTLTVLQQRNTCLFLFHMLLLSLPLWHTMRPNLPFLSAALNALLMPGGLLSWKVWLVKDTRLLLSLTKVMKIDRLTSLLLDAPRQSSPRPRRKHGRRLALLSHQNLTLNLYTLSPLLCCWLIFLHSFLSPFWMGLTNLGRVLEQCSLLSISLKLLTRSGIPSFSTN